MHMPVRFAAPKCPRDGPMTPTWSRESLGKHDPAERADPGDSRARNESGRKVLNININVESEEEPVVNVNWTQKSKKQVRFDQCRSVNLDDAMTQVSQYSQMSQISMASQASRFSKPNGFDTTFSQHSCIKLLNTENSEPEKASVNADFLRESKKSLLDESFSTMGNINRIPTKRKLSLGSFDCEKPEQALNEIRNIYAVASNVAQSPPAAPAHSGYQFQKIQDQLRTMNDTRTYRYEQLISRAKKCQQNRKYRLAQEETQEAFLGCLGAGGWKGPRS